MKSHIVEIKKVTQTVDMNILTLVVSASSPQLIPGGIQHYTADSNGPSLLIS